MSGEEDFIDYLEDEVVKQETKTDEKETKK